MCWFIVLVMIRDGMPSVSSQQLYIWFQPEQSFDLKLLEIKSNIAICMNEEIMFIGMHDLIFWANTLWANTLCVQVVPMVPQCLSS